MKSYLNILLASVLLMQPSCSFAEKPGEPDIPDVPVKHTPGTLVANGNDAGTYELIESCGFIYQVPDNLGGHEGKPERHIHQVYDKALKKYVFAIKLDTANDIDFCLPDRTDRQRNEIAIAGKDPSSTVADENETLKVEWKFFLPEDMVVSDEFCHIYQIKALCSADRPSDIGMPIITVSLNEKNGSRTLSIGYKPPYSTGGGEVLFSDDLSKYLGRWIKAESTMTVAVNGALDFRFTDIASGTVLGEIKDVKRDYRRDGATGTRPKWGLYRSLGADYSLRSTLRDETVLIADVSCKNLNRQ